MHDAYCSHVKHVNRQGKHDLKTDSVLHRRYIHHIVYTEATWRVASSCLFGKTLVAFSWYLLKLATFKINCKEEKDVIIFYNDI